MLGTVCRAGDLLDLFDVESPEWGATAVSRRLLITKSQAHEMLVSLESIGLLRRVAGGRFRLGWKMVTLSQRLLRSEFTAAETRIVREFARHAGTGVDIFTYSGDRMVRIGGHGPSGADREERLGRRPRSAAAKVLLSGMPIADLARLLPDLSAAHLELVADSNSYVAFDENAGRHGVAAPVNDHDGTVLAALSVTVSSDTWAAREELLTKAVVGTARRISISVRERRQATASRGEVLAKAPTMTARIPAGDPVPC